MSIKIAQVPMHRWTLVNSANHLSVHDFPHLDVLFEHRQAIYRWSTPRLLIFSSSSQAFFLPVEAVPNTQGFAVRQLTPDEIANPTTHFSDTLLYALPIACDPPTDISATEH